LDDTQVMQAVKPEQVKNADAKKILNAAEQAKGGGAEAPKKAPAPPAAVAAAAKTPAATPPPAPAAKPDKTPAGITGRAMKWLGLADVKQAGSFAFLEKMATRFASDLAANIQHKLSYNKWSDLQSRAARLHSEMSRYREKRTPAGIPPRKFYELSSKYHQMQTKADDARKNFMKLVDAEQFKSHAGTIELDELDSPYN
jgi:hypothetical protein